MHSKHNAENSELLSLKLYSFSKNEPTATCAITDKKERPSTDRDGPGVYEFRLLINFQRKHALAEPPTMALVCTIFAAVIPSPLDAA